MKKWGYVPTVAVITALSGCQTIPVAKDVAKMELSFDWPTNAPCFGRSPAFNVSNIPQGTKYLEFNMRDLDAAYRHGGGTVEYTGSNALPEGVLKNYQGPCPPGGTHTYKITVKALNAEKTMVLGIGASSRKFPE